MGSWLLLERAGAPDRPYEYLLPKRFMRDVSVLNEAGMEGFRPLRVDCSVMERDPAASTAEPAC